MFTCFERYLMKPIAISSLVLLALMSNGCGSGGSNEQQVTQTPMVVTEPEVVITHEPAELEVTFQCDANTNVGLTADMTSAITLAESRYTDLLERTASSSLQYIDYTDVNGRWELQQSTRWTSGFLPGILWYLYGLSQDTFWQTEAQTLTQSLLHLATATDNDTGFQVYGSYGIGRTFIGDQWLEADLAINEAANTLIDQRYNSDIGAFRAWPQSENDPFQITSSSPFEVNVDMIMNMEVILSAAEKSGNTSHINAAISHADVTWDNLIRADFSSYHVAGFNADGSISYTRTHQGWYEDSTWSRGQSWAVYGYAMLYRYTALPRMLERSEKAYQYFKLATQSQGEGWIPYADFDAAIDIRNPLDTSAAAIVASSAIELYELTGNTLYLNDANNILNDLVQNYLSTQTNFESILLAGSEQYVTEDDDATPDSQGYEVGASFGDFYFLEALYRLKNTAVPDCN